MENISVKQVHRTVYECTDGEVFTKIDDATNHQRRINIEAWCENQGFGAYSETADAIVNNHEEIARILTISVLRE